MKTRINNNKVIFSLVLLIVSLGILSGCAEEDNIVYCDDSEPGEIINVDGK